MGHEEDEVCYACCGIAGGKPPSPAIVKNTLYPIFTSAIFLATGLVLKLFLGVAILATFFFVIVLIIAGHKMAWNGLRSLFKRRLDIHFLLTVAAIGAFLIGHGEEGALIVFLFSIAEFLERYAVEKTRRSLTSLMKMAPEKALLKVEDGTVEVHTHEVRVGDIVVVKPGEKIPLDGVVISGFSTVNQSSITGEPLPASKAVGDTVFAGTINNEGYMEVRVTRRSNETLLSKIIRLVEEARAKRSAAETFVEKFASYYTPLVLGIAAAVGLLPPLLFGYAFEEWVYRSLILLVLACPCALVISTPVSLFSAITSAARNGVLVKGGKYMEALGSVRAVAFDKTGTLTEGAPEVTDIIPISLPPMELLSKVASLENASKHPIAKAVMNEAMARAVKLETARVVESVPGLGMRGRFGDEIYYVGSSKLLETYGISYPRDVVSRLENEGKTVILAARGLDPLGVIGIRDRMRSSATKAIRALKSMGIQPIMVTGDNEKSAAAVAKRLGIGELYASLLPEEKMRVLERLKRKYGRIAMVGDGVNDAPALARADVGIAMGVIGSETAMETADVGLMGDELTRIPYLIQLSRKTRQIIWSNILGSILAKAFISGLAFLGVVTLWMSVAVGDLGLSLVVILNAMRLALLKLLV